MIGSGGPGEDPRRPGGVGWAFWPLVVVAIVCAASGVRELLLGQRAPWLWLLQISAGCALLTLALGGPRPRAESRLRIVARWIAAAMGTVSAIAFVGLVQRPGEELKAGIAVGAALFGFLGARWLPFAPGDVIALTGADTESRSLRFRPPVVLAWVAIAIAAAVAATLVNQNDTRLGFALWLASLLLFAAACWPCPVDGDGQTVRGGWRGDSGAAPSRRTEFAALLLIVVLAAALRVVALDQFPFLIDPDEGRQGRWAERMWSAGFPDAFGIGWNSFPHLSYLVLYLPVQIFGTSNANLRLSAALIGVLSLLPVYFWARRWWGVFAALLAVFLLAINREHIFWSRVGFNNIHQVLVAGLVLAAFARVLRTRRAIDWVWLGYAMGLGFHTYHSAKLYPALIAAVAALLALGITGFLRRYASGAAVGAAAFALLFGGPHVVNLHAMWGKYYQDTSNRIDLHVLRAAYAGGDVGAVRDYLWAHVVGCLRMFFDLGVDSLFDPYVSVFLVLGAGWMLWHWRDPRHMLVLIWIGGIVAVGGMITSYPPWKPRMLGLLPAACIIPAVVVGRLRARLRERFGRRADPWILVSLVLWLAPALHSSLYAEFVRRPQLQRGEMMTSICKAIDAMPLPGVLYMVGGYEMAEPTVAANDCLIADDPRRRLVNLADDPHVVPLPPEHRGHATILVAWPQRALVPLLQHHYPEARHQIVHDPYGNAALQIFTLSEQQIERSRGLRGIVRTAEGVMAAPPAPPLELPRIESFPAAVSWRGLMWVPEPGDYEFAAGDARVWVAGRSVGANRSLQLVAGWQEIRIDIAAPAGGELGPLHWRVAGTGAWSEVSARHLHRQSASRGLLGRYYARELVRSELAASTPPPDFARIDPAIAFDRWFFDPEPPLLLAARPSTMRWSGSVRFGGGGPVSVRLEATSPAEVYIGGELVVQAGQAPEQRSVEAHGIALGDGAAIEVYVRRTADDSPKIWNLRLLWSEDGAGWNAFPDYRPEAWQAD